MAKLSLLQFYDPSEYTKKMNDPGYLGNPTWMIDPGDHALFIEMANSKTFLYMPENVSGSYLIATYDNIRPEQIGHLIEEFVGERDVRAKDVAAVQAIIRSTKMGKEISTFDWAFEILERCENGGLLKGKPSSQY